MTLQTVFLCGACVIVLASSAAAQDYPRTSTPTEQAQTQQLNAQAAATDDSSQQDMQSDPSLNQSQQDQYQQQQQQYQSQQQNYQQQRAQYHAEHQQYVQNIRQFDAARYEWTDYPRVYAYRYEGPNLRRLYLLADPAHQLANVPVEGASGRYVGKVRNVETGPDGRPQRVEIALNRMVSVWVSPDRFRFDADDRVLFTDLTRDDLWQMPGATVESADANRP